MNKGLLGFPTPLHAGALTPIVSMAVTGATQAALDIDLPPGFCQVQIRAQLRGTANGDYLYGRFNSDSGANYDTTRQYNNGVSLTAGGWNAATQWYVGDLHPDNAPTGPNSASVFDILLYNYGDTKWYKQALSNFSSIGDTGPVLIGSYHCQYKSFAPLTKLKLFPSSGLFVAGSRLHVWGIPDF